jgi:hypothetical protein
MSEVSELAAALSNGREVRQHDNAYTALCPAHDDNNPSLSITQNSQGKMLYRCHAGCTQDAVISALNALGLRPKGSGGGDWKVLSHAPEEKGKPTGQKHPNYGNPAQRWEYRDASGRLVGYIYRFNKPDGGKELMPLAWCVSSDGAITQWRWKSFNKPRPLYQGHKLRHQHNHVVLVVEGEKTADAAQKIFPDYCVITWPGGTGAVKLVNWEVLKNRDVVIWPDADMPGHKAASQLAEILADLGARSVRSVTLPDELPEGWDLADEPPAGIDVHELLRTAKLFEPSGDAEIDKLNATLALALLGDKATIIREEWSSAHNRLVTSYISVAAMRVYYANQQIQVGRQNISVFDHWLEHRHRRTYDAIVFEPGIDVPKSYNLWRGFAFSPDVTGDWSMFKEHLFRNIAQGDESLNLWILGWFAQMVQCPRRKPGTSIAIRGKMGTGKTVVGQHFGALIRDNYVLVDDPRYVVGNFNSHMSHALLLHADEGFFAGDPRHVGRLKGLVTSNTNRIELKGKESFEINNYLRLMITSNASWVVPTGFEERRFAVVDCGEGMIQNTAYFEAMRLQLEAGGYEGLLHHLQHLDLSTVDLQQIPKTGALLDQKQQSLDPVERFWLERIQDGEIWNGSGRWDTEVPTETLYQAYIRRAQSWGVPRRVGEMQFGKDLKALMPGTGLEKVRRTVTVTGDYGEKEQKRVWCYAIPPLDLCRQSFEAAIGAPMNWNIDTPLNGHKVEIPF